nr:hypothetical protein 3 [Gorica betanecrovirus 1]
MDTSEVIVAEIRITRGVLVLQEARQFSLRNQLRKLLVLLYLTLMLLKLWMSLTTTTSNALLQRLLLWFKSTSHFGCVDHSYCDCRGYRSVDPRSP